MAKVDLMAETENGISLHAEANRLGHTHSCVVRKKVLTTHKHFY